MKRTAVFTLVIILLCGAFFLISRAPQASGSSVAVQYLGMTNDPAIGRSAILCVVNRTGRQVTLSPGPFVDEKREPGWSAISQALRWKLGGATNTFGPQDWVTLSLAMKREMVIVVPEPVPKCVWRVTFQAANAPSKFYSMFNHLTFEVFDRFFPRSSFSTSSPEIHD